MFDLDISLFIQSMFITIICYFDCSHVKHVDYYYKLFYFQSGRWWLYRIQSGNTEWIVTHEVPRKERAGDSICRDLVLEKTSEWKKLAKLAGWSPMDLPVKWHFVECKFDMKQVFQNNQCLGYIRPVLTERYRFWFTRPVRSVRRRPSEGDQAGGVLWTCVEKISPANHIDCISLVYGNIMHCGTSRRTTVPLITSQLKWLPRLTWGEKCSKIP